MNTFFFFHKLYQIKKYKREKKDLQRVPLCLKLQLLVEKSLSRIPYMYVVLDFVPFLLVYVDFLFVNN